MITIRYSAQDSAFATRLLADLRARGNEISEGAQTGREHVLILVLSPAAVEDAAVRDAMHGALDAGQRVIPVLAKVTEIPKVISHLAPLDMSGRYDADAVNARLEQELTADGRAPMRVLTPSVKASNQRALLALGGMIAFIFIVGIYLIITFDIESPAKEYQRVDTEAAQTINAMIEPTMAFFSTALPRSTEQAVEFDATLERVPTLYRAFVALTATAIHEQLAQFESTAQATPTPEA